MNHVSTARKTSIASGRSAGGVPACAFRAPQALPGPLALTIDGKILAIAHSLRDVRLIETETGRELATLSAPEPHPIHWLCFGPDGNQLAVVCENRLLQLWDLRRIRERLAEMGLDWE